MLDCPEGVTLIGAAVLDDLPGVITLAVVGGIATAGRCQNLAAGPGRP